MDVNAALAELEALAVKLDVTVVYDTFTGEGMGPGGLCRVQKSWRVIIDRRASANERVSLLARALSRFDLEGHFLSPQLRQLVERAVPQRGSSSAP